MTAGGYIRQHRYGHGAPSLSFVPLHWFDRGVSYMADAELSITSRPLAASKSLCGLGRIGGTIPFRADFQSANSSTRLAHARNEFPPHHLSRRRMLISLAVVTVLVHFLCNRGYGYFHDEFYAIACSKHLAVGIC